MLFIIVVIAIVSVLWAAWSVCRLKKDSKAEKGVKEELSKGRVIYQEDGESSEGSSDSLNKA